MLRFASSLFVVFMLLVGPALCVGGLLEHECDCGQGGAEMQCQHEDSCSDDPCESLATPLRDACAAFVFEAQWVAAVVVCEVAEPDSARWPGSSRPPRLPARRNLPYAQSDRPLLI